MQEETTQNNMHSPRSDEDFALLAREPVESPGNNESIVHDEPVVRLKDVSPVEEVQSPLPLDHPPTQQRTFLPQRGLYYATIAGVIAGVVAALLTIVITLLFAGTFHAVSKQIAVDALTVKTALALAGLELLNVVLSLLVGFFVGVIVGRIAVRRRLGFMAGVLAGAIFSLITFLVSLIPSYPGNLTMSGAILTTGSLILSFLLLCLVSLCGGLISLFGTWVVTVRHPHYLRPGEYQGH